MASPKHHPLLSGIHRAWINPLQYSWLRLRRDWTLNRPVDHVVGEEPSDSWLILTLRTVHWLANAVSPWEWLNYLLVRQIHDWPWLRSKDSIKARYWLGDIYILVTTILTVPLAIWAGRLGPHAAAPRFVILAFCLWRLFEIWRTMLRFVVVDYIGEGYPHTTISAIRYLMYIPQYAIQMVFIFAVIYLLWTPGGFSGGDLPHLAGIFSYGYVSLTTITTLGSGYTAVTPAARAWQIVESATGLVLFGLGISTFLSGLRLRGRHHRSE